MSEAFQQWCRELRDEIKEVYVHFDFVAEHWRDDFEKGWTPAQAFMRIITLSAEADSRRARH